MVFQKSRLQSVDARVTTHMNWEISRLVGKPLDWVGWTRRLVIGMTLTGHDSTRGSSQVGSGRVRNLMSRLRRR